MADTPIVQRPAVDQHRDPDARPKITTIGSGGHNGGGAAAIEAQWKRRPDKDGKGATHVRTFTGKMNAAGLEHLDRHVNEWLDNHPDAEVKFSTIATGEMGTSLGKESVVVVQVWI